MGLSEQTSKFWKFQSLLTPWACRISFLSLFSLLGTWCSLWLLGSLPCCFVIFSVVDSQILPAVVIMGVLHCSYLVFFLTIVWCSLLFSCALRCSLLLECPLMLLGIFHCCCWVLSFVVVHPLLLSLIAQWSPLLLNMIFFVGIWTLSPNTCEVFILWFHPS